MSSAEQTTTITAPPDEVWAVLADFGAIATWVPMIQHSCLLSDVETGPGAVRRVQIARQTLVERVTAWEPGRAPGLRHRGAPADRRHGEQHMDARSPGGDDQTEVTLTTEIPTGRNPVKRLIAGKVLERMSLASQMMLAGLTATVAADPAPSASAAEHHAETHAQNGAEG